MPALAISVVDVVMVLGLGVAGFLVVAMVCALILALLQLVLPSTDTGAADLDRLRTHDQMEGAEPGEPGERDTEVNT